MQNFAQGIHGFRRNETLGSTNVGGGGLWEQGRDASKSRDRKVADKSSEFGAVGK
jgi:hypothetical protein